ncbi:hypothetical protein [Rhizobium leguminosarum]|uniref:hypothetical protein n=1 Tax=Rhizobium leguminosarum TaxID=384 RepID=UPI002E0F60DD|nr:hypothetical protein U8Q02_43255 [Rhizobium leguminosarum]
MRIIGGTDYYDTAMALGQDRTVVFARRREDKVEAVPFKKVPLVEPASHTLALKGGLYFRVTEFEHDHVRHVFYPRIVWLAGHRHGGIQVDRYDSRHRAGMSDPLHFWHCERLMAFLAEIGARLHEPRKNAVHDRDIDAGNIETFFTDEGSERERSWLIEHGISIATSFTNKWRHDGVDGWKFDVDGLKNLQFQKLVDPYEAFQRLSQWVGGVLPRPANPTVDIKDEKTMLAKHGMDSWSFRRPPSEA